ncbi:MAG: hypothetical protein QM723_14680 [Myxococcaceae bacterium]
MGANTVPEMVVVPASQVACWRQRLVQMPESGTLLPQTLGTPAPPQMSVPLQLPQLGVTPPQPSPCWPQLAPS